MKSPSPIRLAGVLVLCLGLPARAGLLVDHQPFNSGGGAADTDFVSMSGQPNYWQLVADDFTLGYSVATQHVVWWGFYGGTFGGSIFPPSVPETMRMRLYSARPADGLPGDILYEESFVDPLRVWTGGYIQDRPEYRFEADLGAPFYIDAGTRYWLEVAQLGIPDSLYRWEFSQPGDGTGIAYLNPAVPDWQSTLPSTSNCAFQLWGVPEPSSLAAFLVTASLATSFKTGGLRRRPCKHRV